MKKLFGTVLAAGMILSPVYSYSSNKVDNTHVRVVELDSQSIDEQTLSREFKTYQIDETDTKITFTGVTEFNANDFSELDFVSDVFLNEEDIIDTEIITSFDIDTMMYYYKINFIGVNGDSLYVEEDETPAIVKDDGTLDAIVNIDGEEYLMSDFEYEIDEVGFRFKLAKKIIKKVVVKIAIPVVVVTNVVMHVQADINYEINKALEDSDNGLSKGSYVSNQYDSIFEDYQVGFTTFDKVGCEIASAYNLLIDLDKGEYLSETIKGFEKQHIVIDAALGAAGSNPREIGRYLDSKGISYTKYSSSSNYDNFITDIEEKENAKFIVSNWNDSIFDGLHTWYTSKSGDSYYKKNNGKNPTSIEEGRFIVAYIINE